MIVIRAAVTDALQRRWQGRKILDCQQIQCFACAVHLHVCYWFKGDDLRTVSGHMGSSTSASRDQKKQRCGPGTDGESLIGIRAEPPQQGSRAPAIFVLSFGRSRESRRDPPLDDAGIHGCGDMPGNAQTLLRLGRKRRSS